MHQQEEEVSLKNFFIPFTTAKGLFWIISLGFLAYFNGLFNGFVLDDSLQVTNNPYIKSIISALQSFTGGTFYNGLGNNLGGVYYKPLLSLFFSLVFAMFGINAYGYHFFQIILHVINACLVFYLFKTFFRKSIAFLLSLIFLLHPIMSESVFYISAVQEVLFFSFGITALYLLATLDKKRSLIIVSLCIFLSLLSKETGILFLAMGVIYAFMYRRKLFYPILGFSSFVFVIYLMLRIKAVGLFTVPTNAPIDVASLTQRILTMPEIVFFYLKTFAFPLTLSSSHQWVYKTISVEHFVLPLIIDVIFFACCVGGGIFLSKNKHFKEFYLYIFFGIWFVLGLLMHLQIFPLDITAAERYFYFTMVGVLGIAGVVLSIYKINFQNKWVLGLVSLILFSLFMRTFIRSFDWRDEFRLASHDIKVSEAAYDLENIMSITYLKEGNLQAARYYGEKSVMTYPFATNLNTLGLVYLNLGDYKNAKKTYEKSLSYGDYYWTYENLGGLAMVSGDFKDNVTLLATALKKFPYDSKLWLYLALLEYQHKNINVAKQAVYNAYYLDKSDQNLQYYNTIMTGKPLELKFNFKPQ